MCEWDACVCVEEIPASVQAGWAGLGRDCLSLHAFWGWMDPWATMRYSWERLRQRNWGTGLTVWLWESDLTLLTLVSPHKTWKRLTTALSSPPVLKLGVRLQMSWHLWKALTDQKGRKCHQALVSCFPDVLSPMRLGPWCGGLGVALFHLHCTVNQTRGNALSPGAGALQFHVTGLGHSSHEADITSLGPVDRGTGSSYPSLPSAHRWAKTDKLDLSPEWTWDMRYPLWKLPVRVTGRLQPLPLAGPAWLTDSTIFPQDHWICRLKGAGNRLKQSSPSLASPALKVRVGTACFAEVCRHETTCASWWCQLCLGSWGLDSQKMRQQGGLATSEYEAVWENTAQRWLDQTMPKISSHGKCIKTLFDKSDQKKKKSKTSKSN